MVAAGHSSVGVIVGTGTYLVLGSSGQDAAVVAIAFLFGIISHYLTDAVPHGHYDFSVKNKPDIHTMFLFGLDVFGIYLLFGLLSLATTTWLASLTIIAGMTGALLPDIVEGLIELKIIRKTPLLERHRNFHYVKVHWPQNEESPLKNGARPFDFLDIWQIAAFILAFFCIVVVL